ncbi:FixH family protein [Chitinophaga sp. Cy-1792]|uniref:FixH family protein n=1 Tax=Chitinophaga sp. Cy-1792 TaxID=2608339 RepID=UPI0014233278|nr:FixH family protein [Chitinophaga sp. Cy-1792]NIG52464.1 FixH family protein [Chitinophaga sp. Cy-1792]
MNWGYKIIIVFTLFAAGMLTLVTKSMRTKIDMVTNDYYSEELKYQDIIEGRNNAGRLSAPVKVTQPGEAVAVSFPEELIGRSFKGNISFYRPSDSNKDFTVPMQPDNTGTQTFGRDKFIRGNYRVKIQWEMDNKPYYQEEIIHIN